MPTPVTVPLTAPYIALAGPTAAGKTAAALAIAEEHDCEIISVDSALVYRGMDIGTAKPSAAELASVPHHLINIRDPLQAYSAAEFVRAELEEQARVQGWPALHTALAQVDPLTAARLAPNDSQRIQRALEVFRISGQPLSSFHARQDATKIGAACAQLAGA